MLLVHQTGSVKVGELFRYTITYTPSQDRILPLPSRLHVKVRNSSAIPLRAAYLHGPYTLHVAAYPSSFNPNHKVQFPVRDGVPQFEPNLKAGGSWMAQLMVPEHIREAKGDHVSVTWVIEITSMIIFSSSASVNFELLVARDEKSLDLGLVHSLGLGQEPLGQVQGGQRGKERSDGSRSVQQKGIFSRAVKLVAEDTNSLWNKPPLPTLSDDDKPPRFSTSSRARSERKSSLPGKQKKVHLVILTHGLHGNLRADMLYLKESIDATAKQAREDILRRKRPQSGKQDASPEEDAEDLEEVIVRGFPGNVTRTEKGIQYLGKRLAKYVLELTYPDQPYLPIKRTVSKKLSDTFSSSKDNSANKNEHDSMHRSDRRAERRGYRYTSISFVGHSLGGVVQTYAIAYIHKHSPEFFSRIQPINFVALASPLLGLSNENPIYVKFALDFGLVGRTGQDLGLFWRTPAFARTGWSAVVGGLGGNNKQSKQEDPAAKPLLRILPTGPAHQVLRMFRNRTLYSNAVNDGIVPLRTSCLLFLDWGGLSRVEKARRENGLIGTMASWGWAELTGANSSAGPLRVPSSEGDKQSSDDGIKTPTRHGDSEVVPQPPEGVTNQDDEVQSVREFARHAEEPPQRVKKENSQAANPLHGLLSFLRPSGNPTARDFKMYRRSQTIQVAREEDGSQVTQESETLTPGQASPKARAIATSSFSEESTSMNAPPKTTVFESAGDILNPPIPPTSWIIDPASRARTIFHDRVYHPEDIPAPPPRRNTQRDSSSPSSSPESTTKNAPADSGGMKVEEKIARAYHRDLSWRKVLVRLEPDAHNNIIVRRMFANAYGWPVIKHLCDTHFADTYTAATRDENEPASDRATTGVAHVSAEGEEVSGQRAKDSPNKDKSEMREARDELAPLKTPTNEGPGSHSARRSLMREDSAQWDDSYFGGTTDDEDDYEYERDGLHGHNMHVSEHDGSSPLQSLRSSEGSSHGRTHDSGASTIATRLTGSPAPINEHRGLSMSVESKHSADVKPPTTPDAAKHDTISKSKLSESPKSLGSPASIGLQKSLDGLKIAPNAARPASQGSSASNRGVSEQVARLSQSKGDVE